MKVLSVRPPWAYYIIYGVPYGVAVDNGDGSQRIEDSRKVIIKDVENRAWPIPSQFVLPQRIQIQVGKRDDDIEGVLEFCVGKLKLPAFSIMMSYSKRLPRGAIIGEVDITDCLQVSKSPWAIEGQYHFILSNPISYETPIPCKGKLGLFELVPTTSKE